MSNQVQPRSEQNRRHPLQQRQGPRPSTPPEHPTVTTIVTEGFNVTHYIITSSINNRYHRCSQDPKVTGQSARVKSERSLGKGPQGERVRNVVSEATPLKIPYGCPLVTKIHHPVQHRLISHPKNPHASTRSDPRKVDVSAVSRLKGSPSGDGRGTKRFDRPCATPNEPPPQPQSHAPGPVVGLNLRSLITSTRKLPPVNGTSAPTPLNPSTNTEPPLSTHDGPTTAAPEPPSGPVPSTSGCYGNPPAQLSVPKEGNTYARLAPAPMTVFVYSILTTRVLFPFPNLLSPSLAHQPPSSRPMFGGTVRTTVGVVDYWNRLLKGGRAGWVLQVKRVIIAGTPTIKHPPPLATATATPPTAAPTTEEAVVTAAPWLTETQGSNRVLKNHKRPPFPEDALVRPTHRSPSISQYARLTDHHTPGPAPPISPMLQGHVVKPGTTVQPVRTSACQSPALTNESLNVHLTPSDQGKADPPMNRSAAAAPEFPRRSYTEHAVIATWCVRVRGIGIVYRVTDPPVYARRPLLSTPQQSYGTDLSVVRLAVSRGGVLHAPAASGDLLLSPITG
ncbi:hypothetical protein BDK51DRAFT_48081 [Blyttiomyces helicus]|uniref:Uncharacterized protein n=1 Tax=Blyttiomyces helicus TaxID=388810 RepID=A0A4P9WTP7_9FUNG|nr:hypothetical protein BDK51DRAFT_48081 [Blyttiomyces helicus]|eukprot:RKO94456.1 hypothetical protein BDK51DRAFT_48081 [Blyttiomyces helicus]